MPQDDPLKPPFLERYPQGHAKLDQLVKAFLAGNYGYVREHADRVADESPDASVAAAARDLRRRIEPAPTAKFLWALGVALVAFLFVYYVRHSH